ncbi:hypothetical protein C8Q80DRAFT_1159253 [Daedaleopsis nitida]|nr:hypothetical protein C8Q80DRAFT_1159253 [Daedaleopsis nitida]
MNCHAVREPHAQRPLPRQAWSRRLTTVTRSRAPIGRPKSRTPCARSCSFPPGGCRRFE